MLSGFFSLLFGKDTPDCFAFTDPGLVRRDNQDSYFVSPDSSVICVADGMGGGEGGAVASKIVCEEIAAVAGIRAFTDRLPAVDAAIQRANERIRAYSTEHRFAAMGSTAAILLSDPEHPSVGALAWIGDSRVYRRRNHVLLALTQDHRKSQLSHFLTRAISGGEGVHADWKTVDFRKNDVYLVCSDGIHDMLPDSTINAILLKGGDAESVVKRLADAVRRAGARDNFTLALIRR